MGISQGWERWIGNEGKMVCMHGYGASAPAKTLFEKFGFTVSAVLEAAREILK
jgi:transketolase